MINQQKNNKANYEAPTLEIIEVKIEQGFAASPGGSGGNIEEIGGMKPDLDW